jgi:cob(I)alamin adenosyltransferase
MSELEEIRQQLGLVQIYTGNGKGKTTAALGLALRASGRGLNVLILQFMKPSAGYGEQVACERLGTVTIESMGLDHFVSNKPKQPDIDAAKAALKRSEDLIATGDYDIAILDEAMNAVRLGLITSQELIESLDKRPEHVEIVLTGRGLTPELEEYADLVTEMRLVKHPMDRGIGARKGIEYRLNQGLPIQLGCGQITYPHPTSLCYTLRYIRATTVLKQGDAECIPRYCWPLMEARTTRRPPGRRWISPRPWARSSPPSMSWRRPRGSTGTAPATRRR